MGKVSGHTKKLWFQLPESIHVIGSGAIGIEFASFYNDLGVDITVVEVLDRILPAEDIDISNFTQVF